MFIYDPAGGWVREIPEESCSVRASYCDGPVALRLQIEPAVSMYRQHAEKRIAAGVYFEIAAKYAEKVGGRITQLSNVNGCTDGGVTQHVVAQYPQEPLLWERVCRGFKETILGEGAPLS